MVRHKIKLVFEGANMPITAKAIECFKKNDMLFQPYKASNAEEVGVSGLQMSQNSLRLNWTKEEVDSRLQDIMKNIHTSCVECGCRLR